MDLAGQVCYARPMRSALFLAMVLAACGGPSSPGTLPVDPVGPDGYDTRPADPVDPVEPTSPPAPSDRVETDTLLLDGTPEIPGAMRERLAQYLNTRSASATGLSDDGARMLISTRFADTSQVHLVAKPLGARTQITFAAEPIRGGTFVPGTTDAVLYRADIGGNEQHQIFRLDLPTGVSTRLTDEKARNGSYAWSKDGKQLAFASNSRNGKDFDVWVSDGKTAESAELLVEGAGWWYPMDWSADGKKLLVGEYISINVSRVYVVDVATKKVTRLTPKEDGSYPEAKFAKGGTSIYVTSDREGEFVQLFEVDATGAKWKSITGGVPWNVESFDVSHDGKYLAYTTNEGGYGVLHVLETRRNTEVAVRGMPKGVVRISGFARKAAVLALNITGPTTGGDAYTYDIKKKKLTRWTASEMGGLDSANFISPELVEFETFDGAKIPAFYYKPKGQGPFPVLVNIHGGPEGQSRPYFSSFTQYLLAEAGIAVIYPNVRGSSGYGKTYLTLDNGFKREDSVKDIGALLDWIGSRQELDSNNIGVLGGSYGGYMVLASLVHYGDRIKAGTDVVGISSFITFLENTADYRRDLRRAEYGDERDPDMRAHFEKIDPLNNVDKIKSALFVAQGANDPRVPASEAEQIVAAVRGAGHDVWYMLAKNEGHGFSKRENRDTYLLLTAMFFEKHLKGQ